MQSWGFYNPTPFPGAIAWWYHSDPFSNSVVKRLCSYDTLGVAPRDNRSVPGSIFNTKTSLLAYSKEVFEIFKFLLFRDQRPSY